MRSITLCSVVGLAATTFSLSSFAQSSAADCHRIEAPLERVACYDRASGRAASAPGAVPATAATAPGAMPASAAAAAPGATTTKAAAPAGRVSMIDSAWGYGPGATRFDYGVYKSNYLLFARWTDDVNVEPFRPLFEAADKPVELKDTEAKFQLSFKGRVWTDDEMRWSLWAAYTQQSSWQVYNSDVSRPFRDTNYMPELFGTLRTDIALPFDLRMGLLKFGFNHQSNGRSDVLSRSWNRLIAETQIEGENLLITARVWHRLSENEKDDDNPLITRYLGQGELAALYRWSGHTFTGSVRGNVSTRKGAVQLGWTTPPLLGPLRGYVQVFSGYGESLIDYNWKQNTIGIGVSLNDGL